MDRRIRVASRGLWSSPDRSEIRRVSASRQGTTAPPERQLNNTHCNVLVALRDWFAAQQDGSEQAAAAALRDHMDLLPAPFAAASRPGLTLAESAVLNALDAYLQAGSYPYIAPVPADCEPAGLEDAFDRR